MATLIIPNTYQVAIKGRSGGQDVINVIGISGMPGQQLAVAEKVKEAWTVAGGPLKLLTNLYTLESVRAVDLSSASGGIAESVSGMPGSGLTAISTNGAAALVSLNSGNRNRSTSGRLYFGPLGEGNIKSDGRSLENAFATSVDAAFLKFQTTIREDSPFSWVIISRKLQQSNAVGIPKVQPVIATQRRRIRGR